jgi:hypothetical protein
MSEVVLYGSVALLLCDDDSDLDVYVHLTKLGLSNTTGTAGAPALT